MPNNDMSDFDLKKIILQQYDKNATIVHNNSKKEKQFQKYTKKSKSESEKAKKPSKIYSDWRYYIYLA